MSKISIGGYVAPWVLPNEEIPMHVTWSPDLSFDKIRLKLPSDLKVVDILNVDKVVVTKDELIIKEFKQPLEGVPSFFGIVLTFPKIFNELKLVRKIHIEFLEKEKILHCLELNARIFRPLVEPLKVPKEIELFDEPKKNRLPLHLRYIGFGDIEVNIQAKIKGRIVSIGESLVYELLRRLWLSDIVEKAAKTVDKTKEKRKKELWLEPAYVRAIAQKLEKKLDSGIIPTEELDAKAIAELREWLSDVKVKDRFMGILYEKTESILLDLLVDLFERNPTSNVELSTAKTIVRTRITAPITNLEIIIRYKDKVGNNYPEIVIPVQIHDRRTNKKRMAVEMPILIETWKSEPFMNVRKMKDFTEG